MNWRRWIWPPTLSQKLILLATALFAVLVGLAILTDPYAAIRQAPKYPTGPYPPITPPFEAIVDTLLGV